MAHSNPIPVRTDADARPSAAAIPSIERTWPKDFRELLADRFGGKRVLVAGADGFLGYNCVLALRGLGAEITAVSRRVNSHIATLVDHIHHADLTSPKEAAAAARNQAYVFDFAGTSGAVSSNSAPSESVDAECRPQLTLFEACARSSPEAVLVFPSTRLVYGKPQYLPVDESHALAPQSMYAASKIAIENYLRVFERTYGLRSVILRLSNPYGPNMLAEQTRHNVINRFMYLAARGQGIRVFGDGSQKRDYLHVYDAINAFMAGAANERCHGQTFNVGGTLPISIRDAVDVIASEVRNAIIEHVPWPASAEMVETGDYYCTMAKVEEYLQLPPRIPIERGLRATTRYFMERLNVTKAAYV